MKTPQLPRDFHSFHIMTIALLVIVPANPAWAFAAPLPASAIATQDEASEAKAADAIATASNAFKANDFEGSAKLFSEVAQTYPNSKVAGQAHFFAALSYEKRGNLIEAKNQMASAVAKLDAGLILKHQARLYLGSYQYQLGKEKLETPAISAEIQAEATELLTTATQTLGQLMADKPEYEDGQQAFYLQGSAFDLLGRDDEALAALEKMERFEKQTPVFKLAGLFTKAGVLARQGKSEQALETYLAYRASVTDPTADDLAGEVTYGIGQAQLNLGLAAQNAGQPAEAEKNFKAADATLAAITNSPTAEQPEDYLLLVDDAKYIQAFCARELGDFARAGSLYESIATRGKSEKAQAALAFAGRSYLDAKETAKAQAIFQQVLASDSQFAPEAAHQLALSITKSDPQRAYDLAKTWIEKTKPDDPALVDLKMDQADAAFQIEGKLAESVGLFEAIATAHPNDRLAPTALYYAADAALRNNDPQKAIELAQTFATKREALENFKASDYLADMLAIKADSQLLEGKIAAARETLDELIQAFPNRPEILRWKLRDGFAAFVAEDFAGAIERLSPIADALPEAKRKAEAHHWIGSSHLALKQPNEAITALNAALAADSKWSRGDETLMALCRAQLATEKIDDGIATANRLREEFVDSPLQIEAAYLVGDELYKQGKYADALTEFRTIADAAPDSPFAAPALYSAAWCQTKLDKLAEAEQTFTRLIEKYGDEKELVQKATVDRAAARNKSGKAETSITDLEKYLANASPGAARVEALRALGNAYVSTKQWDNVIKTFDELLTADSDDARKDAYWYEIAWAYRSKSEDAKALEYFGKIADQTPDSDNAPEANFHVATDAYNAAAYDKAIQAYGRCFESQASDELREKAAYKLAWSYYKQEQFESALKHFKEQVDSFPQGNLLADGLFMKAESEFRLKQYPQAYQSYIVAKPVVEASDNVETSIKWLTRLHGAQSANSARQYNEAIALANELVQIDSVDASFLQDAHLELGIAYAGLKENAKAVDNYRLAAENRGKTGARARCMIGAIMFSEKKFEEAIDEFKKVYYGFRGREAIASVKPWQAYAIYEAARCKFVQVDSAPAELKPQLIADAISLFEYLVEAYGDDKLAEDAARQIQSLKRMQAK